MNLEVSDTANTQANFLLIYLDCHDIPLEETTIYFLFRRDILGVMYEMTKRMITAFLKHK